jgi:hypothetical protein
MDLTFLDPTAEPGLPITPYELRADLAAGDVSIGLLANSFVDSEEFLRQIAGHLADLVPGVSFNEYDKTSPTRASEMISEAVAAGVRNECTAVITAYGH